ncbi:MAG: KaiC domain-containing protein [Candidatus Korarchaeota archaeon NZ13-K]|nr:MAG: KaiC domain-containing protein [Candidatus Korarchaeota archaeon NZ13-K]
MSVERLSTGVGDLDRLIQGGVPRGFLVAVAGEPGTGKTVLCLHFIWQGVLEGDKAIYVTTEESRESLVRQAEMLGMGMSGALEEGRLVVIDALLGGDRWSLRSLSPEEMVERVLEAKKEMGYGRARLAIDSMSAFWLDKPAMARKYSYFLKKVLSKWDFTVLATTQYAITTSEAFGFGLEHIADGIIRFRRIVRGGRLRRFLLVEKMRQTDHDLRMYEVLIEQGRGMRLVGPVEYRAEDFAMPRSVYLRIAESRRRVEEEVPDEGAE